MKGEGHIQGHNSHGAALYNMQIKETGCVPLMKRDSRPLMIISASVQAASSSRMVN